MHMHCMLLAVALFVVYGGSVAPMDGGVDVDGRNPALNGDQVRAAFPASAENRRRRSQGPLRPEFHRHNFLLGQAPDNAHLRKQLLAISQSAHDRAELLRGLRDPSGRQLYSDDEINDVVGLASRELTDKATKEDMENNLPYIRARFNQLENPGFTSDMVVGVHEKVVNPIMAKYYANKDIIDLIAKMTIIVSGMAYIFSKFGGTEWIRNKIREAFDKPRVYTIRNRKKRWFSKWFSKDKGVQKLMGEGDLVLAPGTRKQVDELLFLINRRYAVMKKMKKSAPLPLPRVLLWGPPGTAKTSIAQYIADHAIGDDGKPMIFIKLMAADFMQIKDEGDRIAVLKEMFELARKYGNVIIFLDEIDGMTGQRGQKNEGPNRGFLDHLLDEIATPSTQFMVIGATNHIERMDNALLSRLTRKIGVGLPAQLQRKMILDLYINRLLVNHGYNLEISTASVASVMKGSPGRELESFVERLRERLDFLSQNTATKEVADEVLREMGKLPPLVEHSALEADEDFPSGSEVSAAA